MSFGEFYDKYFSVNLSDYKNIGIDLEITKILFAFLIGLILATVVINFRRATLSNILKKLIRIEAKDEESAKTLEEIKMNTFGARLILSSQGRGAKIISRVGEKKYTYEEYVALLKTRGFKEEKIDFSQAKFYINSDRYNEAQSITELNSPTLLNTVLFCLLSVAVFVCLMLLIPGLLSVINNALG